MTIEIAVINPQNMKKVVARAFGVSSRGDRLTIRGRGEPIYIDFVCGEEPKTPVEVLNQISKEYFERRKNDFYIVRDDMMVAKEMNDVYGKRIRKVMHRLQTLRDDNNLQEVSSCGSECDSR